MKQGSLLNLQPKAALLGSTSVRKEAVKGEEDLWINTANTLDLWGGW